MTDDENPYQSPDEISGSVDPIVSKRFSILRGLAYSALYAPIGFLIPPAYFLAASTAAWFINGMPNESPAAVVVDDFDGILPPSIGISIVFAMAAFRNFTPAQPVGMIRSLIFVGLSLIAGGFIAASVSLAWGLENNSYDPDPWLWLKSLIALAAPVRYVCKAISADSRLAMDFENNG